MSELLHLKMKFTALLPRLIDKINSTDNYSCTISDVLRPWRGHKEFIDVLNSLCDECEPKVRALKHKIFYGSGVSLHRLGLAADINLFSKVDGIWKYLDMSEHHRQFGEYWLSLDQDCEWGGSGRRNDGNHYSIRYKGRW